MSIIAYLPAVICLAVIYLRSVEKAFLGVYLPFLLIFSQSFCADIQGLPNLSFAQAAILPLAIYYITTSIHKWTFSLLDAIILVFIMWNTLAEFCVSDYKQAQNVFIMGSISTLFPYILAKGLIVPRNLSIKFAKRFAFLIFLNLLVMLHSIVFNFSIHDRLWRHFFPEGMHSLWFDKRFGFPRLPASFNHPILAGVAITTGYRISRWLEWSKKWGTRFKTFHPINVAKSKIIRWGLFIALILTFSRGPWVAACVGAFVAGAARSKKIHSSLICRLAVLCITFLMGWTVLEWYVHNIARAELFDTILYRWHLWDMYKESILQKPIFGWGVVEWPIGGMQRSVDNYFLYLTVSHGFPAAIIMITIMAFCTIKLFIRTLKEPAQRLLTSNLSLTLLAIQITFITVLGTVWMDSQLMQIFFLLLGWTEGHLLSKPKTSIFAETQ